MVDAVTIADEGIGETAEIEQTIPVSIVARETGDFEAEHYTDMAKGDLGGQPGKAVSLSDASCGNTEIFIDDNNLLRRPSQARCLGDQGVLSLR
jgi:hypothetical protein